MSTKRPVVRGETRLDVWKRRAVTVPLIATLFLAVGALAPLWIPIAAFVDLARGSKTTLLRSGLMLMVYLTCEVVGIAVSFGLWVRRFGDRTRSARHESDFRLHFQLQTWWATTLMTWSRRLFRLRIHAEGLDALDRPMILMLSHSSIADSLLANEFISKPHGIHLRYLLKRELLLDPCLDIVGHRLPNYFIDRDSDDPEDVRTDVQDLLSDLRENEGALIYPEGTRFTSAMRDRIISRFEARGNQEMADRARGLRHTLTPRLGGALAMLEANSGLDVVFCAHIGFGVVRTPIDLISGALLDARIDARFERIPFEQIPVDPESRRIWLLDQWQRIDDWIGSKRISRADASSRPKRDHRA